MGHEQCMEFKQPLNFVLEKKADKGGRSAHNHGQTPEPVGWDGHWNIKLYIH